jgi:hypothetical protein
MEVWFSISRQAEIFRRRQTQHNSSVENGATSAPQTTQGAAFFGVFAARETRGFAPFAVFVAEFFLGIYLQLITP